MRSTRWNECNLLTWRCAHLSWRGKVKRCAFKLLRSLPQCYPMEPGQCFIDAFKGKQAALFFSKDPQQTVRFRLTSWCRITSQRTMQFPLISYTLCPMHSLQCLFYSADSYWHSLYLVTCVFTVSWCFCYFVCMSSLCDPLVPCTPATSSSSSSWPSMVQGLAVRAAHVHTSLQSLPKRKP